MEILNGLFRMIHIPNNVAMTTEGKYEPYPPCGDKKYATCFDCPRFDMDECKLNYNLSKYIIHGKEII